jgi:hypothetical protein
LIFVVVKKIIAIDSNRCLLCFGAAALRIDPVVLPRLVHPAFFPVFAV